MDIQKKMKKVAVLAALISALPARGQKVESYIFQMGQSLVPYGTVSAPTCHQAEIHLSGPWGNFAIPSGTDANGELTWMVLKIDTLQIDFDLSELDEDNVKNQAIFSLGYLAKRQKGTRPIADTPMVMFSTNGLNTYMLVQTIDPEKMDALKGQVVTDRQMGLTLGQSKVAFMLFTDQQHADAFERAIRKAIVLCKAQ